MSPAIVCEGTSAPRQLKRWVVLGGMGPGAPGFARAHPIADTGELSLATLRSGVSEHEKGAMGTDEYSSALSSSPVSRTIDHHKNVTVETRTTARTTAETAKRTHRISVIIPTRNEEQTIPPVLRRVFEEPVWEVIVVDGGSTDNTRQTATDLGATVLTSEPGRGRQLHTGATAATGDVLLFLHADTLLPKRFQEHVIAALSDPRVAAGAFKLHIDGEGRSLRFIERLVQLRSRYRQMPYGDQAIFMRAETYHRAGGFPDLPLMEDYELIRRLRRLGRIRIAPVAVRTSARRWQELGVVRATLTNQLCLVAFRLGVSPKRLANWRDGRRDSSDFS